MGEPCQSGREALGAFEGDCTGTWRRVIRLRASRLGPAMFQAALPEPGRWHVVAVCGRRERAVMPATIDVVPGRPDVTIRLSWPQ